MLNGSDSLVFITVYSDLIVLYYHIDLASMTVLERGASLLDRLSHTELLYFIKASMPDKVVIDDPDNLLTFKEDYLKYNKDIGLKDLALKE